MSFREVRNFTERMRILGYPETIFYSSFKQPNFPLMAKILVWLLRRYDPTQEFPLEIDTTESRILFLKSISQTIAIKTKIRLNNRKLYLADGYCVQELLKLVNLLYDCEILAQKQVKSTLGMVASGTETELMSSLSAAQNTTFNTSRFHEKLAKIPACRELAQEITEKGSLLFDMLQKELDLRDQRNNCLARPLDLPLFQKEITLQQSHLQSQANFYQGRSANCNTDCQNLLTKIDKKRAELERCQKRLKSLQGVRPAYMDEFERLEVDLKAIYEQYIDKFRHLAYLEQALEEQDELDREKTREAVKDWDKMRQKVRKEKYNWLMDKATEKGFDSMVDNEGFDEDDYTSNNIGDEQGREEDFIDFEGGNDEFQDEDDDFAAAVESTPFQTDDIDFGDNDDDDEIEFDFDGTKDQVDFYDQTASPKNIDFHDENDDVDVDVVDKINGFKGTSNQEDSDSEMLRSMQEKKVHTERPGTNSRPQAAGRRVYGRMIEEDDDDDVDYHDDKDVRISSKPQANNAANDSNARPTTKSARPYSANRRPNTSKGAPEEDF